jgi:hypothetical protein
VILSFRARVTPKTYWFAWRPVRATCGAWVWLDVVRVHRGFAVGIGTWIKYEIIAAE